MQNTYLGRNDFPTDLLMSFTNFQSNGVFTPALRELFIAKRTQLGISHSRLSYLFNVSPQSVWNWEQGITRHCSQRTRLPMLRFLSGCFDILFESMPKEAASQAAETAAYKSRTLDEISKVELLTLKHEQFQRSLFEITRIYQLIEKHPLIRDSVIRQLGRLCVKTMKTLNEDLAIEQAVAESATQYRTTSTRHSSPHRHYARRHRTPILPPALPQPEDDTCQPLN